MTLPFRARIEELRLGPNVPAGCNLLVLASLAHMLRGTNEDPPPIAVTAEPDGTWRIADGRHRVLAAIVAGRPDVLAVEAT